MSVTSAADSEVLSKIINAQRKLHEQYKNGGRWKLTIEYSNDARVYVYELGKRNSLFVSIVSTEGQNRRLFCRGESGEFELEEVRDEWLLVSNAPKSPAMNPRIYVPHEAVAQHTSFFSHIYFDDFLSSDGDVTFSAPEELSDGDIRISFETVKSEKLGLFFANEPTTGWLVFDPSQEYSLVSASILNLKGGKVVKSKTLELTYDSRRNLSEVNLTAVYDGNGEPFIQKTTFESWSNEIPSEKEFEISHYGIDSKILEKRIRNSYFSWFVLIGGAVMVLVALWIRLARQ